MALFIGAIMFSTDEYMLFVNFPSMLIVLGGTMAASFLGQEARYVVLALKGIMTTFLPQRVGRNILNQEVGRVIRWGYLAQQKGLVALDQELKKVGKDPFLSFGMEMVLSGYSGDEVRDNLERVVESTYERNLVPANILKQMGATAPAFGMIGTLIGLVIMLAQLKGDPSQLGEGLAVALVTTLYGVVVARLVFIPASNKVTQRQQINRFRMELLMEGLCLLADRKNPRHIQDRMNSFLDPAIRYNLDKQLKK